MTAPESLAGALRRAAEGATQAPWRACAWDPMERPHVHKDEPKQTSCKPPDVPLNAADATLIVLLRNSLPRLVAAAELAEAVDAVSERDFTIAKEDRPLWDAVWKAHVTYRAARGEEP